MRAYDHEDDKQSQQQQQEQPQAKSQLDHFDEEYNLAKLTADIGEANYLLKAHQSTLKKMQRDVDSRVTESHLSQAIALINAGIHPDPNVIKLLKTKEERIQENAEEDKVRMNAGLLSRKLNQMSEALSMLLAGQKRLQAKVASVEGELSMQISQKANSLQLQVEEAQGESSRVAMELSQRVELTAFELGDKMREVETKLNWRLTEFKTKIDQKINEELVLIYLEDTQKKVQKEMQEFQLSSNIDPLRIDRIQQAIAANRTAAQASITECNYSLRSMRKEIDNNLVRVEEFQNSKISVEKRLNLFNDNFMDVYRRVITCEKLEVGMQTHITQLLTDCAAALTELKRINTVLLNIKISDDFQRMLEEMNPAKVLELQDSVDTVKSEQTNIFRQIAIAKRQIAIINAKSENMGFLTPNSAKEKLKKQQIEEALHNFLVDNQFAQKIASLDKQLTDYRNSMDSVATLSRQVARLQKESDFHRLAFDMQSLEEYVKRELAIMDSRLREKQPPPPIAQYSSLRDRPGSNRSSLYDDPLPLGEASLGRSFSTKKMGAVNLSRQTGQQVKQLIQIKTSRR